MHGGERARCYVHYGDAHRISSFKIASPSRRPLPQRDIEYFKASPDAKDQADFSLLFVATLETLDAAVCVLDISTGASS